MQFFLSPCEIIYKKFMFEFRAALVNKQSM